MSAKRKTSRVQNGATGAKHYNWRGGRTENGKGYVLIWVGRGHHLASHGFYALEHRVVMEQKLGRRLLPGEVIHHVNHDTRDNRPENLELTDPSQHAVIHGRARRKPRNLVPCGCGCGELIIDRSETGKPRRVKPEHRWRLGAKSRWGYDWRAP